jgi:hypothetical protein
MTRDKDKFLSLSESKSRSVTFANDALGKIKGKGMVSLSNGKGKSQDVLLVDGLKHNLLSGIHVQGLQVKVCKLRTSGGQRHKDIK